MFLMSALIFLNGPHIVALHEVKNQLYSINANKLDIKYIKSDTHLFWSCLKMFFRLSNHLTLISSRGSLDFQQQDASQKESANK